MITTPTVLVLGAGASAPFGFPTGRALLMSICRPPNTYGADPIGKSLHDCGFKDREIAAFREALNKSHLPSVDRFLESRPEFLAVGKTAMARALVQSEDESLLQRGETSSWYEYLYHRMFTKQRQWPENALSVITFNYDRSLEHFLFSALQHSYDLTNNEAWELVNAVPLVHVYGDLGALGVQGRPYAPDFDPVVLKYCADRIHIMGEAESDGPAMQRAQELFLGAKRICFLGFGYDSTNVARLRLRNVPGASLSGSAYGMTSAERAAVSTRMGRPIVLGSGEDQVLEFLRESGLLEERG